MIGAVRSCLSVFIAGRATPARTRHTRAVTGRHVIVAVAALAICGTAAARDIPFTDGPGSAAKIEAKLRTAEFEQPACRYRKPLIVCTYFTQMRRGSTYVAATMTIHKTGPRVGYAVECFPVLGVCNREGMRFER